MKLTGLVTHLGTRTSLLFSTPVYDENLEDRLQSMLDALQQNRQCAVACHRAISSVTHQLTWKMVICRVLTCDLS